MHLNRPYIYALLVIGSLVLAGISFFTRVDIPASMWLPELSVVVQTFILWCLLYALGTKLGRRPILLTLAMGVVETLLLIRIIANVLRMLDHATKAIVFPYADPLLSGIDQAMGLSWVGYFNWVHDNPALHPLLIWSYDAIYSACAAIVVGLFLLRKSVRVKAFIEAFVICTLIAIAFGMIVPARAAVDFWIPDLAAYENFVRAPGVYHLTSIEMLRAPDGPIVLGTAPMVGLTTFPSLHTAMAVLIMLASLRTWLWVPAWAYGIVMIASTPVWGGHYFIDLIGGTVLAVTVWVLVMRSLTKEAMGRSWIRSRRGASLIPAE